jgi:rhodanese-related sulfurtransferase
MYDGMGETGPMSLLDFVRAAKGCVNEVSPQEAMIMVEHRQDLLVLDVRESSEHEQGHIKDALLVPRGILEAAADPSYPKHVASLSGARARPILIYCATGGRSAMAAATLQLMGFEDVYSMAGGIVGWETAGYPLVQEARYV